MCIRDRFIEIQGVAEESRFNRNTLEKVLDLAEIGITKLFAVQNKIIPGM